MAFIGNLLSYADLLMFKTKLNKQRKNARKKERTRERETKREKEKND